MEEALELFQQEVFVELASMNMEVTKRISRDVAQEVDEQYDQFFEDIVDHVLSNLDWAPSALKDYIPDGEWDEITAPWAKTKNKRIGMPLKSSWFYRGISGAATAAKGLTVRRKYGPGQLDRGIPRNDGKKSRSPGKKKVPPFATYLQSLQTAGTTNKFFGPVTLSYQFFSPIPGQKITATMASKNAASTLNRNAIEKIVTRNKGRFDKMSGDLDISVTVEAFDVLKHVQKLEWHIVDYIIKRVDRKNEKQWVKINGEVAPGTSRKVQGENVQQGRKVRPLILPMIQFYINEALPKAMRKGIK